MITRFMVQWELLNNFGRLFVCKKGAELDGELGQMKRVRSKQIGSQRRKSKGDLTRAMRYRWIADPGLASGVDGARVDLNKLG